MGKPRGIVDLDDVLAFSAEGFLAYSNRMWGTNLTIDQYSEDWTTMWGVSHEESVRRSRQWHASTEMLNHAPQADALPVLSAIGDQYDLVVGTSRRLELDAVTREWVNDYFPGVFSAIYFSGIWETFGEGAHLVSKADLCAQLDAAFLIDDQPKHCVGATEAGATGILYGDYAWNRDVVVAEGIVRGTDWAAVGAYFEI